MRRKLRSLILRLESEGDSAQRSNAGRGWQYGSGDLLQRPEMQIGWLTFQIAVHIREYVRAQWRSAGKAGQPHFGVKLEGWANINRATAFNHPHNHPSSHLSGVFYLDAGLGKTANATRSNKGAVGRDSRAAPGHIVFRPP